MKTNPLKEGVLMENFAGIGTVHLEMVRERAAELAFINGRTSQAVSQSEWEQAKRELTGEPDIDPKEAILESAPESDRWAPLASSTGGKVSTNFNDDEDEEGRIDSARLVEQGVQEAEHDQMLQASDKRQGRAS